MGLAKSAEGSIAGSFVSFLLMGVLFITAFIALLASWAFNSDPLQYVAIGFGIAGTIFLILSKVF